MNTFMFVEDFLLAVITYLSEWALFFISEFENFLAEIHSFICYLL